MKKVSFKVAGHREDVMRKLILAAAIFGLLFTACSDDSGSTKACVRKAYCVQSTAKENLECDLDATVTKAKKEKYQEEGTFKEAHEECWDF